MQLMVPCSLTPIVFNPSQALTQPVCDLEGGIQTRTATVYLVEAEDKGDFLCWLLLCC